MPHIIATTGDLGWSGKEYEYVRSDKTPKQIYYTVSEFLEKLFTEAESEQIICCPGNHDKKQNPNLDYFQNLENPLSGNDIKELLPFFESFSSGLQKYSPCMLCNDPLFLKGSPKKQKIAKYLYGYRIFNIGETQILFIVMNSAWLCDYKRENGTDQGKLQIGVNQAQEIVRLLDEKAINAKEWPTVIMFHHPTHAWLSEMERNNPNDLSSLDRLKHLSHHIVFLHGHQHFDEDTIYATKLADLIRYGISSGQYHLCDEPYLTLSQISKSRWNWRAFSFSIDYLIEKINHIETDEEQYKLKHQALVLADQFIEKEKSDQAYFKKANILSVFYGEGEEELTEGDVLQIGLEQVRVAPKCALRLADIMFDKGEYQKSIENLQKCCINTFNPQPDINSSYAFLLLALSKASKIFSENQEGNNPEFEALVHSMYKDFHTAIRNGLNDTFSRTANTAIKVIEAQTGYEYPYTDAAVDDPYDF